MLQVTNMRVCSAGAWARAAKGAPFLPAAAAAAAGRRSDSGRGISTEFELGRTSPTTRSSEGELQPERGNPS
eukprot:7245373-Pyramimonas_sp.AAC.1